MVFASRFDVLAGTTVAPPFDREASSPRTPRALLASLLAAEPDALPARVAAVQDWPSLLEHAALHGVDGALVHRLETSGIRWPGAAREAWTRQQAFEALASRRVARVLEEALEALAKAGIAVCPLKGPALAMRVYPVGVSRRSSDVDLLVRARDTLPALEALARLGFVARGGARLAYELTHHHQVLLGRGGEPPIELHRLAFVGFGAELGSDVLLDRATEGVGPGGLRCAWLRREDEILYLLLHAAGHQLERLGWLYDVKLLVEASASLDVEAIRSLAAAHGLTRALAFAAAALERELGVALPVAPVRAALGERSAQALMAWSQERPRGRVGRTVSSLLFHASLAEEPRAAARYVTHHLARIGRHRMHRMAPGRVPASWEG